MILKKLYILCLERKTVEKNKILRERNRKLNRMFKSSITIENAEKSLFYVTILSEKKNFG